MKKTLRAAIALILVLCLLLPGCGRKVNVQLSSFVVSDQETYSQYNTGTALAAFEINDTAAGTEQIIYIWDNQLCEDLYRDLRVIMDQIPDRDRIIRVESGTLLKIRGLPAEYTPSSEASRAILLALFPEKCLIRANELLRRLNEMEIRLRNAANSSQRDVVALRTVTELPLRLDHWEHGVFHPVYGPEELIGG